MRSCVHTSSKKRGSGLRAPIFEEKVVDFLIELAGVTEKKVARDELYKEDDSVA